MKSESLDDFVRFWKAPPRQDIIAPGLLVKGGALVLFGQPGSWKSWLALDAAIKISQGLPWLGFSTTKTTTEILQLEVPKQLWQDRVNTIRNGTDLRNVYHLTDVVNDPRLDSDYETNALGAMLMEHNPGLFIVDPVYKIVPTLNDDMTTGRLVANLDKLRNRNGMSLMLVHHPRKRNIEQLSGRQQLTEEDMTGIATLQRWTDTVILVEKKSESDFEAKLRLSFLKHNHVPVMLKPIMVTIDKVTMRMAVAEEDPMDVSYEDLFRRVENA